MAQQQECSNRSRPTESDAPVDIPSTIQKQKSLDEQQLQSNYQVMFGQNQQFQQWFDQQRMQPLPAVEENLSHADIELRLQLAERLQSDSERNAGRIDQLQIAPRVIIVEKESHIIPGPLRRLGKYVLRKHPNLRTPQQQKGIDPSMLNHHDFPQCSPAIPSHSYDSTQYAKDKK